MLDPLRPVSSTFTSTHPTFALHQYPSCSWVNSFTLCLTPTFALARTFYVILLKATTTVVNLPTCLLLPPLHALPTYPPHTIARAPASSNGFRVSPRLSIPSLTASHTVSSALVRAALRCAEQYLSKCRNKINNGDHRYLQSYSFTLSLPTLGSVGTIISGLYR